MIYFTNKADQYYYNNIKNILDNGTWDKNPRPKYKDGEPAYTKFITGVFETYDLTKGEYPITTYRNTAIKTGLKEILWIYQKESNSLKTANKMGINWWDEWDIGNGTIGKRYGYTVKKYNILRNLIDSIDKDPFGRRHIMNLYQENDLQSSKGLYPCAFETMWSVREIDGIRYLDCTLIQRSNDYIMAGYINKIQYVGLQLMLCSHFGYNPGIFNHLVQNLHIYDRHIDAAKEILDIAKNRDSFVDKPFINLHKGYDFHQIKINDFIISDSCKNIPKLKSNLEIAI